MVRSSSLAGGGRIGAGVERAVVIGRLFIWIIRGYQRFVSPLFPPSCRFTPNCSRYTIQAIQKYGPIRGGAMGAWRILRCNPFGKGGYDPVK